MERIAPNKYIANQKLHLMLKLAEQGGVIRHLFFIANDPEPHDEVYSTLAPIKAQDSNQTLKADLRS